MFLLGLGLMMVEDYPIETYGAVVNAIHSWTNGRYALFETARAKGGFGADSPIKLLLKLQLLQEGGIHRPISGKKPLRQWSVL